MIRIRIFVWILIQFVNRTIMKNQPSMPKFVLVKALD